MKTASLVCGIFAAGWIGVLIKYGYQSLYVYLLAISLAASVLFYRAGLEKSAE